MFVVVEHSSLASRCETEFDGILIKSGIRIFGLVPNTLASLIQGKFLHYFPSSILFWYSNWSVAQEVYCDSYSCYKLILTRYFFQPGQELFPKDEAGNVIYADINPVDTWKVCIVIFIMNSIVNFFNELSMTKVTIYLVLWITLWMTKKGHNIVDGQLFS